MLENKGQKQRNKMQISFQKAQILILFEKHTRADKIQNERETSYDCLQKERQKSLAKCTAREKQCVANCTFFQFFSLSWWFLPGLYLHYIGYLLGPHDIPERASVHT